MTQLAITRNRCLGPLGLAMVCAVGFVAVGCNSRSVTSRALDASAEAYVQLAVDLGQRDADSLDFYSGSASKVAETLQKPPALRTIHAEALQLAQRLRSTKAGTAEEEMRKSFLLLQVQSIAGRTEVLAGVPVNFDDEARTIFGVIIPASYNQSALDTVQAELQKLLPGKGNLAERYQAFDDQFLIPAKLLPAVMARAVEACKAETKAHITLPKGESTTIEYVRNRPWSAFSLYKGGYHSVIQINRDLPLTVDRALNIACHEAYPGHHTYNSIRDAKLVRAKGLVEYSVQPTFSPQSMISESIATIAVDVAFPVEQRLALERDVLFPIAGLSGKDAAKYLQIEALVDRLHPVEPSIAREYLDGRLEFERAGEQLQSAALMVHPEAALLYMNEYRSYVTTYTYGRDLVAAELLRRSGNDQQARWEVYAQWMCEDPQLPGMHHAAGAIAAVSHAGGG
jgi:hypothetical protein